MATVGILLAAGRGHRFDSSGFRNKLLSPLPGDTAVLVAVASARHLLAILPNVIAVVPPDDGGVAAALRAEGCEVTVCKAADSGMGASLVHALRHSILHSIAAPTSWIIGLADMPFVKPATIAALRDALGDGAGIAAPVSSARRGNPVAFSSQYLPLLLALEGDQGARDIVRSNPVTQVLVDDDGIFRDIDTPSDLDKTLHFW